MKNCTLYFWVGVLCGALSFVIYHQEIVSLFHFPLEIILTALNPMMIVSAYFAFGSNMAYVFGAALSCVLNGLLFSVTAYGFLSNRIIPRILSLMLLVTYLGLLVIVITLE